MPVNMFLLEEISTDILIGNNIIIVYRIVLDNSRQQILLPGKGSANITIDTIICKKKQVKLLPVRAKGSYKIPAGFHQAVEIRLPRLLLPGQDYMFTSTKEGIPNSYIGAEVGTILFTNPTQETVVLKKGTALGTISSISRSKSESIQVWDEATDEIRGFFGISKLTACLAATAIPTVNRATSKGELEATAPLYSSIKGIGQKLKDLIPLDNKYQLYYKFPLPKGITIPSIEISIYKIVKINSGLTDSQTDILERLIKRYRALFNNLPGITCEYPEE
jgi:hypothetical protein